MEMTGGRTWQDMVLSDSKKTGRVAICEEKIGALVGREDLKMAGMIITVFDSDMYWPEFMAHCAQPVHPLALLNMEVVHCIIHPWLAVHVQRDCINLPHAGSDGSLLLVHCDYIVYCVWSSGQLLGHLGISDQLLLLFHHYVALKHGIASLAACHPCVW